MTPQDLSIRPYHAADECAIVQLWHDCGLTRPWNDPVKDIARKLTVQSDLFLVGEAQGALVGTLMGAMTAIAVGSTTWRFRPRISGAATPPR